MNEIFAKRFIELEKAFADLPYKSSSDGDQYVATGDWQKWVTSL